MSKEDGLKQGIMSMIESDCQKVGVIELCLAETGKAIGLQAAFKVPELLMVF